MKRLCRILVAAGLLGLFLYCSKRGPEVVVGPGTSDQGNAITGIQGKAFYPNGSPAASVEALLFPDVEPLLFGLYGKPFGGRTDALGIYRFMDIPVGHYSVAISDANNNGALISCEVVPSTTVFQLPPVTLLPSGALSGRIILPPGTDPTRFKAVLYTIGRFATVDTAGRFTIAGLAPDTYSVRIQSQLQSFEIVDAHKTVVRSKDTVALGDILIPLRSSASADSEYIKDSLAVQALIDTNHLPFSVQDISWTMNHRIVYLHFFGDLTVFPAVMGRLDRLEYFGVQGLGGSGKEPLQFAPEIGRLKSLKSLELLKQNLLRVPREFGQLSKLLTLNLSGNALDTLPPFLFNMVSLRTLKLSNNRVRVLPERIGNLTGLMILDLSTDSLKELPAAIGKLTMLRQLNLFSNQLSVLPVEITSLNCLVNVDNNLLCDKVNNWVGEVMNSAVEEWINTHYCPMMNCSGTLYNRGWRTAQACDRGY